MSYFLSCCEKTKRRKVNSEVENFFTSVYEDLETHTHASTETAMPIPFLCSSSHSSNQSEVQYEAQDIEDIDVDNVDNDFNFSSSASGSDDEGMDEACAPDLKEKLAGWALEFNISHRALGSLLNILNSNKVLVDLPQDPRTLLATPRCTEIQPMSGGSYCYLGVANSVLDILQKSLTYSFYESVKTLTLHINIDGLPLFHSSNTCLWPILGLVKELENSEPFPIGIFCGESKPGSVDEFLSHFISEMKELEQTGFIYRKTNYRIKLDAIICDAPARQFIKCIKGHAGYNSCERCDQIGKRLNGKISFPAFSANLRTDEGFREIQYLTHQIGVSPFSELSIGLVTQVPLDYMHLVCLGVVRRLVRYWVEGERTVKLSRSQINQISGELLEIKSSMPKEFTRKPRSLLEVKQWKATECRSFLLYSGPVVLKYNISQDMYSNFLRLSIAMRILLCPSLLEPYLDYAEKLLLAFVKSFAQIYGSSELIYNVHSLIHLVPDARRYGVLDSISAFPFENYLGKLKKLIRTSQNPLAQVVRRISEAKGKRKISIAKAVADRCRNLHLSGPLPVAYKMCSQYRQYKGNRFFISTSNGDNCFEVSSGVGIVKNILLNSSNQDIFLVFDIFEKPGPFFHIPVDSEMLSIFHIQSLAATRTVLSLCDIIRKCVLIPNVDGYVILPQLHST